MMWPRVFFLWFIIFGIAVAHLHSTTANITAPWEVHALKAVRGSLIDPEGNLDNWNRGDPCMENWSYVICYNKTASDGYLHLQELQLLQLSLQGTLAPELGQLSHMQTMNFMWNSIGGCIPKELGNITALNLLNFNSIILWKLVPIQLVPTQKPANNFSGTSIPSSYGNITTLLKFDLSHNHLNGSIPGSFSGLPNLQILSLDNNNIGGSFPPNVWQNVDFRNRTLTLDFQNNSLSNLSNSLFAPANVTILLYGNPGCATQSQLNTSRYCQSMPVVVPNGYSYEKPICARCSSGDIPFEMNPVSPIPCLCALPLNVNYELTSPIFWDFLPYQVQFKNYLSSELSLSVNQLEVSAFTWSDGPRLTIYLKIFPNNCSLFNKSEVLRITGIFTGWLIKESNLFGPYEVLYIDSGLEYYDEKLSHQKGGRSRGATIGIIMAAFVAAAILLLLFTIIIRRRRSSKKRYARRIPMKIDGVQDFTFRQLSHGTNNFSESALIGRGGYGKVYRGVLADGTIVAVKRAQEGSLQGSKEFFTEIELLSRLHHRNLVPLLGYCDEGDEQMLVYEFMPNGTLREHLSVRAKEPLDFPTRLRIALGSSRGILYLHTEADPPIFHRDIKASNILLDSKWVAKVADFGLSRLAPVPEIEGSAPGHVSTVVKGTPGYLDPEYFLTHKLTDKSDVYSLGVVFLELLTGMQPISHGRNIVREIVAANQSGMLLSMVDSRMGSYQVECVERFGALALWCCRDETDTRPSMVEVVRELEMIWSMISGMETAVSSGSSAAITGRAYPEFQMISSGNRGSNHHVSLSSLEISGR